MSCRALAPLVLLSVLTWRVVDLWRAGDLDPVTLLLVPVAAGVAWWLVRQPGCDGAACAAPGATDAGRPAEHVDAAADVAGDAGDAGHPEPAGPSTSASSGSAPTGASAALGTTATGRAGGDR